MTDILDVLQAQVGTGEGSGGVTKYGQWLDAQSPTTHVYADADWCAASLLYCIAQIPGGLDSIGGLHKDDAYVQNWHNRMKALGRTSRTPKPRRLVFYNWAGTGPDDNHIGMLKSVSGNTLHVYEGNHNNQFQLVTRTFDSQVVAFAEWWDFVPGTPTPAPVASDNDDWFIQ